MISKYSSPARKVSLRISSLGYTIKFLIVHTQAGDEELCVRFIPLSVLVYEAIVEEILQYDYAPSPRPICYEVNIPISTVCTRRLQVHIFWRVIR